ncbi:GGDEF domain-containing protein [Marinobacterium rhizophilum]|uniref:GGDEF domain-containing protein n=1 Tax=Marinobacterium rhizophilum TaxID=420402 RepID=UPI0003604B27|nr:GGDEF domain-containing protein [Marinobacterium rhizophilum]
MKFAENSNQAADYLRRAIPLMVKFNIPPNPLNYALWYTYVSERMPELNTVLDKTVTTYGTCPVMVSEQLFREHMIKDELESAKDIQSSLIALMNDLNDHAHETARRTCDYSEVLQDSLSALTGGKNSALPLESIINNLALNTEAISATTRAFQTRIDDAQAEIATLKAELQRTRQDARIDPLTGLFNRRVFDTELQQLISSPDGVKTTIVLLDIDFFKNFNDQYGHLMGDKVLQYVGKLLLENTSEPLLSVRFGGEEFAILLPGDTLDRGIALAENLRDKIQAIRIKLKKSGEAISSITASFGVTQYRAGETAEDFIGRADSALYRAKSQGRNQVQTAQAGTPTV